MLILAVNVLVVNVLVVNCPLPSLYSVKKCHIHAIVSKSVLYTLYSVLYTLSVLFEVKEVGRDLRKYIQAPQPKLF